MELMDRSVEKGWEMEERTGPHTARVLSNGLIQPVQRFE
jgi:hypothetical protein